MKKLTDLLKEELKKMQPRATCEKCGEVYYKDEMYNLDEWVCTPCESGTN